MKKYLPLILSVAVPLPWLFLELTGKANTLSPALVSAMHITAAVYVNDAEEGLIEDIDEWLERLAPARPDYRHHLTGEDNGDTHLKNLLVHHQVLLPITKGRLDLGTWQQVYYAEFDGQRRKRVLIKVLGE